MPPDLVLHWRGNPRLAGLAFALLLLLEVGVVLAVGPLQRACVLAAFSMVVFLVLTGDRGRVLHLTPTELTMRKGGRERPSWSLPWNEVTTIRRDVRGADPRTEALIFEGPDGSRTIPRSRGPFGAWDDWDTLLNALRARGYVL